MPDGVRTGTGGRTGRGLPLGKAALGGYGLGGLVWMWLGLVWARYFAPSLPPAAAAAAAGELLGARAGATPCAGGVPGAAAWLVGAVAWPAGAAFSAPCAPGAPSGGGASGFAAWAVGGVFSVGAGPCADSSGSAGAARGRPAPLPPPAAAPRAPRGSSPVHPGETGERERDRRWWQSSRW